MVKFDQVCVLSDVFVSFVFVVFLLFSINVIFQFFFIDNVFCVVCLGVKYIVVFGGSQNDLFVFEIVEKLGIIFVEQNICLFYY